MLVVEIKMPSCAIVAVGRGLATWWAGGNIISLPFLCERGREREKERERERERERKREREKETERERETTHMLSFDDAHAFF